LFFWCLFPSVSVLFVCVSERVWVWSALMILLNWVLSPCFSLNFDFLLVVWIWIYIYMKALLPEGQVAIWVFIQSWLQLGCTFLVIFFYLINSKYQKVLKVFDNSLQKLFKK
jgi:hypothetical protein